ncbi:MAG: Arm DNA-binding domain-containing protein [Bdellovibrionales bacterium]
MLTETQCRNAKPSEKPYRLADGRGLYLEVKPSGTKAWRYRFELSHEGNRKESMFAIGDYAYVPGKETEEEAQTRRCGGRFTSAEARKERDRAPGHNGSRSDVLTDVIRYQRGYSSPGQPQGQTEAILQEIICNDNRLTLHRQTEHHEAQGMAFEHPALSALLIFQWGYG